MTCPHCRESARFVGYRPKTVQSMVGTFHLIGPITTAGRGHGRIPLGRDPRPRRQALTPGARWSASPAPWTVSARPPTWCSRSWPACRSSESTVERTSEAVGHDIGQTGRGRDLRGRSAWGKDAEGKTCAYVSLDLTGLGMQGPEAAAAEGPDGPRWGWSTTRCPRSPSNGPTARASAAVPGALCRRAEGPGVLAEPMRKQAAQVGMDRADRWIALSDAGAGVEDLLRVNFGRVEAVILDFYHASEYLGDLGRRCTRPTNQPARTGSTDGSTG